MKIEIAYIVIIDFDGDIASEAVGIHVFTSCFGNWEITVLETMEVS